MIGQDGKPVAVTEWTVRYEGYSPREEGLREALCVTGNGYSVAGQSRDRLHAKREDPSQFGRGRGDRGGMRKRVPEQAGQQ